MDARRLVRSEDRHARTRRGGGARGAGGFTTDDAFITLRYARHLVGGDGITWNVGEPPLEGYSNFSFLVLGAASMKMGVDPVLLLKWTGALGLLAALCTSYVLARQWVGPALAWLPAQFLTIQRGAVGWSV